MTRIPYHTNQFAHRQQYGGWNWRNDQSQHPDTITNTRYKVYFPSVSITLSSPFLFTSAADPISEKPTISTTTDSFCDPMLQLSTPVKERKTIIRYSNLIKQENL
ncbi:hypothetical protein TNCV_1242891 [Trichonephila clavipes]|nr:hypothetical protein TNCV_1242891 [Trichonephila clavipes]